MNKLTFEQLREASVLRCLKWQPKGIGSWSLSDWGVAAAGELGEMCNVIKKLNRIRDGLPGNGPDDTKKSLQAKMKKEIADVIIYLDLLAASIDCDMGQIVVDKFNEVSARVGFTDRLPEDELVGDFHKHQIVRTGPGATALMEIDSISGERYYGTHCLGGIANAHKNDVCIADENDLAKWEDCQRWRVNGYARRN